MARSKRRRIDDALLVALACGMTVEAAARKSGMSVRTAHRRLSEPEFQQRLEKVRLELFQRASGMLTAAGLEAIKTLVALQESSQPAPVRLGAAKATLELEMKFQERAELGQRVANLEERLPERREASP